VIAVRISKDTGPDGTTTWKDENLSCEFNPVCRGHGAMHEVPRLLLFCGTLAMAANIGCRSPSKIAANSPNQIALIAHSAPVEPAPDQLMQTLNRRLPQLVPATGNREIPAAEQSVVAAPPEAIAPPPLMLTNVIQMVLSSSPDLRAAVERVAIADATLAEARAQLRPKLNISEQYSATNNPEAALSFQLNQGNFDFSRDVNHPGTIDDFHSRLRLEHRLYEGQRRVAAESAADALQSAAGSDLAAARNELVFAAAEAYYRLLQARNFLEVANEAVAQVEEHLRIVRARFDADTAMQSDVLTVQLRYAEVREARIAAENQLILAWAILRNVTGGDIRPQPLPPNIPAAPWSARIDGLQQAIAEAIYHRPELHAINGRGQAAGEDVRRAEAGKRPAVDLLADYDVFSGDLSQANDSYFMGLVLQWNLFDAGRTASDVCRATARLRELQAEQRRLILDIELEVQRAMLGVRDAKERSEVAKCAIAQARQNLHEVEVHYQSDMSTTAQLMDAQLSLSQARVRQTTAEADLQICAAALERAMGHLCATVE
jgi:outer membrane protein TolC